MKHFNFFSSRAPKKQQHPHTEDLASKMKTAKTVRLPGFLADPVEDCSGGERKCQITAVLQYGTG